MPQHVLPKGLRRARNFGFLHPNSAGAVRLLQVLHLRALHLPVTRPSGEAAPMLTRPVWRCACGQPMAVLRRRMPADVPSVHPVVRDKPDTAGPVAVHTMKH